MVFMKTDDECMTYDREVYIYVYLEEEKMEARKNRQVVNLSVGFLFDEKKRGKLGSVFGG